MRRDTIDVGNETDSTAIVLVGGVVKGILLFSTDLVQPLVLIRDRECKLAIAPLLKHQSSIYATQNRSEGDLSATMSQYGSFW
jgi:hypothetical protein